MNEKERLVVNRAGNIIWRKVLRPLIPLYFIIFGVCLITYAVTLIGD